MSVRHIDLELDVLFEERTLHGIVVLSIENVSSDVHPLVLDTMNLIIVGVEVSSDGFSYSVTPFYLGRVDPILGAPLTITLTRDANYVRIQYVTGTIAPALQWFAPGQTAGKIHPFMSTQSETIFARSWIPLQDSPQVRVTYHARVRVPPHLLAVMSAADNPQASAHGEYYFVMPQPIPSYLIALAVGDLAFEPLGPRSGVYAEPCVVQRAAMEFADIEKMIEATEGLYGPYLWGRYDMLVLPPGFPYGGMENPRLPFVAPTVLAGDKSLVSVITHELAHSWSGNLVTNATWADYWLNEGFTVYVERRVIENIYGRQREEMEAMLGRQTLEDNLATLEDRSKALYVDLKNRDPEECFTIVPYEKGALFLRHLEETFGRTLFDQFLCGYFSDFAFRSITTAEFVTYLKEHLLERDPRKASLIPVRQWLYGSELPACAPRPRSDALAKVDSQAESWLLGETSTEDLDTACWSTHEWLRFLRSLPKDLEKDKMHELDTRFHLTRSSNSEIAHQWLLLSVRNHYEAAYPRLEEFLTSTGREKMILPLYQELVKSSDGQQRAAAIYGKARPGYHYLTVSKIDKILGWNRT